MLRDGEWWCQKEMHEIESENEWMEWAKGRCSGGPIGGGVGKVEGIGPWRLFR